MVRQRAALTVSCFSSNECRHEPENESEGRKTLSHGQLRYALLPLSVLLSLGLSADVMENIEKASHGQLCFSSE